MLRTSLAPATVLMLASLTDALAQGRSGYFNVESPQVKSIAIATVSGHDYIVACNTPGDRVEIYDTVGHALVATAPTGAEPVSVTFAPATSRLYTANFLGDSVTMIELVRTGTQLLAKTRRTEWVGDEPVHVTVSGGEVLVALSSLSAYARLTPFSLQPISAGSGRIDLFDPVPPPAGKALKEPRHILVRNGEIFVLNHRGGKVVATGNQYDMDVWHQPLAGGAVLSFGGLGTTNFNMAFAQNGDLWVVGTEAQFELVGEANVAAAPTGFAKTMLWQVTGAATPTPTIAARDLNLEPSGSPVTPKTASLAHVTDVALFEVGGVVQKIYLAGFNNNLVGVLDPNVGGSASQWPVVARIPITPVTTGIPNITAGPRALAVKTPKPSEPGDPGDRIYVLNRLDNSISVIDPATDTLVTTFALSDDRTPFHIRNGRKFLYDSSLSGNGFSSCASCHTDGRSDWLAWNLSDFITLPLPSSLEDGLVQAPPPPLTFPGNKGKLVTQTLQGMLNWEVGIATQPWFTNEPLHWRADREKFENFNPAFQGLLGGTQLSTAEMAAYRAFIMAVNYPPNPEEDTTRVPTGLPGTSGSSTDGSGARRGVKLYHMRPILLSAGQNACRGRSCAHCHALPEGSENLVSEFIGSAGAPQQPLETPGVRLLRQKERVLQKDSSIPASDVAIALFGLMHEGTSSSINQFLNGAFRQDFMQTPNEQEDLIQLVREWDTGVGPMVGRPVTVDRSNKTTIGPAITALESQAFLTNCGVAALGRIVGVQRGFWFDLTGPGTPVWREEPSGATFTQAGLTAIVTNDDVLVFHATPLGSERRFAWPTAGMPTPIAGVAPSSVTLEPLVTNTFWQDVPNLVDNWDIPGSAWAPPNPFNWMGAPVPTPQFPQRVRILQKGILIDGAGLGLNLPTVRHDATRRLSVAGDDIRHGALLVIGVPMPAPQPVLRFTVPIHPTNRTNLAGKRVWESAAELEPLRYYALMLGGPAAPGVGAVLDGTFTAEPPPPSTFSPATANSYSISVINEDGTVIVVTGQVVRLP